MSQLNSDGNILGRLGAIALLAAAGFGLHRLNCPVVKTDACCGFIQRAAAHQAADEAAKAAPVPAK
ncbi:MAG: hypothetical protein HYV14_06565 [Elusimicrobia bacterium]|nr:hypothetical protein [Elusimicrobiota bacterium]